MGYVKKVINVSGGKKAFFPKIITKFRSQEMDTSVDVSVHVLYPPKYLDRYSIANSMIQTKISLPQKVV